MDETTSWWDNFSNKVGQVWNGKPDLGASLSASSPGLYTGMDDATKSYFSGQSPTSTQAAGGSGGLKGWLSNGNNLGTVVQGLGSLTQAYLGFKQLSMAKDQLKFQKESWGKNFANSQKSYNTSLEDRINGRTSAYAGKDSDVAAYLAKHRLGG